MLIYSLLFAFFAVGAILGGHSTEEDGGESRVDNLGGMLLLAGSVAIALLIGFRYKVGADWNNYLFMFRATGWRTLDSALTVGDPGYQIISWIAYHQGYRVWLVNLFCGLVFSWGLWRFCRSTPYPWLAVAVAIPYMVVVVAMGYSRQAVALGILMAGLAAYSRNGSVLRFASYVAVAALFHRTAVVAFPIVAPSTERNKLVNLLLALAAGILFYDLFLGDSMDDYVRHYIQRGYSSQGAAIRITMNLVGAFVFWLGWRRFNLSETERMVWRNFSIAAVVFALLLVISPSSTAVDRMSIYVMPLQVAILSRLPLAASPRLFGTMIVLAYSGLVEFVWLNYAQFAAYWLPYRFYPL